MKASIRQKLEKAEQRFEEIRHLLSDPEVLGNPQKFRDLSVEYARLQPTAEAFAEYRRLERELASARALSSDSDAGMRELGAAEVETVQRVLTHSDAELQRLLLPRDPRDERGIYLEIRAGTGGDEAAIFAGDLLRMYGRYAERQGWQIEALSESGGEHVNKTDSAIRITHLPSGLVVECQDERSQHKNRSRAMALLAARLLAAEQERQQSAQARSRKLQVGSGDRSERIRTYNFPQGRMTDHRINLTLYRLGAVMEGDLDELLQALSQEYQAELLAAE